MMTPLQLMLTILAMGLVTFLIRLSFIALSDRIALRPIVRRGLTYVPPAVLAAIVFPDMLLSEGVLNLSWQNPFLLAGLGGILAAWWSKNVLVTMVVGMLILWGIQWITA